jgi:hypothetical protein
VISVLDNKFDVIKYDSIKIKRKERFLSADVTYTGLTFIESTYILILTNHDFFIHFYANLILKRNTRRNFTIPDFS